MAAAGQGGASVTNEPAEQESSRPQFSLRAILIFLSAASVLLAVSRAIATPMQSFCTIAGLGCIIAGYICGILLRCRSFASAFVRGGFTAIAVILMLEVQYLENHISSIEILAITLGPLWILSAVVVFRRAEIRTLLETSFGSISGLLATLLAQTAASDAIFVDNWLGIALTLTLLPLLFSLTLLPVWFLRRRRRVNN